MPNPRTTKFLRRIRAHYAGILELRACTLGRYAAVLLLWSAAFLAASPDAFALRSSKALHDYVHRSWTVDNGLPQSTIRAIAQTTDGYIWLSNHQGLIRFDGKQFQLYNESNTPALVGSGVSALQVSNDGGLWIGLRDSGVVKMQKGMFTALPAKKWRSKRHGNSDS